VLTTVSQSESSRTSTPELLLENEGDFAPEIVGTSKVPTNKRYPLLASKFKSFGSEMSNSIQSSPDIEILEDTSAKNEEQKTEGEKLDEPIVLKLPKPVRASYHALPNVQEDPIAMDLYTMIFQEPHKSNGTLRVTEQSVKTGSISCVVLVTSLTVLIKSYDIITKMASLGFKMGTAFKNINLEKRSTNHQTARITFIDKVTALAFYRKTKGKLMSNVRNIKFCPRNINDKNEQKPILFCFISLIYTQIMNLDTGCEYTVESISVMCQNHVLIYTKINKNEEFEASKFMRKLTDLISKQAKDLNDLSNIFIFENWKFARVFWSWLLKFQLNLGFIIRASYFTTFSEKSIQDVLSDFEFTEYLDLSHLLDQSTIMDSFLRRIVLSQNFQLKDLIGSCKKIKSLPESLNCVWHENVKVVFLGLSFTLKNGQKKLAKLYISSKNTDSIAITIDPLQLRSEEAGLKQFLSHLKSFNTSILLFLSTSFIFLPVLLQAMERHDLLNQFLLVVVGISDVFRLLHDKCQKMVEDHQKCFLYPNIHFIYKMIIEAAKFSVRENENEAKKIFFIFNNLIETKSNLQDYLRSGCSIPIENVKVQHSSFIEVLVPDDATLESGEINEINVRVSDQFSKNALLLECQHEIHNINISFFEVKNNMATVRIHNISDINVELKNHTKIATIVSHPKAVICPDDVSFLTNYQLLQATEKGIAALKHYSENPVPKRTDEHCFDKSLHKLTETVNVTLSVFPEDSYNIVHISMRVKENGEKDKNLLISEILMTDVESKQTLLHCWLDSKTSAEMLNLKDKICIGGKMFAFSCDNNKLLPIESFENFFKMTEKLFNEKHIILIGNNILSQTEILFKTAKDLCMIPSLKNIVGVADLCWILPCEKQFLSEKPLQEIFDDCLGSDLGCGNNLQNISDLSIKLINLFCQTLSFKCFVSQFCIDRQTCNQLHFAGNSRKKIILKKNEPVFETLNIQSNTETIDSNVYNENFLGFQTQCVDPKDYTISKSKIRSLKMLAQKLKHSNFSSQSVTKTTDQEKALKMQDLEEQLPITKNIGSSNSQPKNQLNPNSVTVIDYAKTDNDYITNNLEQNEHQHVPKNEEKLHENIHELYLDKDGDNQLSTKMSDAENIHDCTYYDSAQQNINNHQKDHQNCNANSTEAELLHKKDQDENHQCQNNASQTIIILCAFTWAKENINTQYISSLDITVAGHEQYSYTVDSIIPPSHWPENLTKKFYNLKDNIWIPKDCTSLTPSVRSEADTVQEISLLFNEISMKFPSYQKVMVTVLPNHIHYLENVCLRYCIKPLTRFFSGWCDLTSLVYNSTAEDNFVLKSSEENVEKLHELYYHACDQFIPLHAKKTHVMLEILKQLSKASFCIETFMEQQMENFCLPKDENYLEVFLHVETTDIDGETVWLTIGFYTPHNGKSWLSAILPSAENEAHFLRLSSFMKCETSNPGTAVWKYITNGQKNSIFCLEKQKVIKQMTTILEKEYHKNNSSGIVFTSLTGSKGGVLHVLKALVDYGHNDTLHKVKGIGDVTTCFESAKHFNLVDEMENLEDLHKSILISKGKPFRAFKEENARKMSMIVFELIEYLKSVDNGKIIFAHPLKSPYTNHLLYTSKEHLFLDSFGDVVMTKSFLVEKSKENHWIDVQLIGCLFSAPIESFELKDHSCSQVKLISKKVSVTKNAGFKINICIPAFIKSLPKGYKIAKAKKLKLITEHSKKNGPETKSRDPRLKNKTRTPTEKNEALLRDTLQEKEQSNWKEHDPIQSKANDDSLSNPDGHSNRDFRETDETKISEELEKFDSIPLFPNLRGILVPYIIHFIQMKEKVPLVPGEDIVIAMAGAKITKIDQFIQGLKLDSRNYDLSYLKRQISHSYPYLEFLLNGHFLFFTKLIQKIVTQNIFEHFPTFYLEKEELFLNTLCSNLEKEINPEQSNLQTKDPLAMLQQCEDNSSNETTFNFCIAKQSQAIEFQSPDLSDNIEEVNNSSKLIPTLKTNEIPSSLEICSINNVNNTYLRKDPATIEEISNLCQTHPEVSNENYEENESGPRSKEIILNETSKKCFVKEISFLEILINSLNGLLLKDLIKIGPKETSILGEIISEGTVRLQSGEIVQFIDEQVPCSFDIEKNDTVFVKLDDNNHVSFLFPLQYLESFIDCRYGFVISHPQKLKTCIGFLLNGHLFKAIVSNENILRDNNEKGQLPIGQVVGINISLPISESKKISADCKANFCISSLSLSGTVIMDNNINCDSWSKVKEFFPDISFETALHKKSNTECNIFSAESSEAIHELLQFLKNEELEMIEWPLLLSTDVENTFQILVTEFEVKLKLINFKLLLAGSNNSVQKCIETLHANLAMMTEKMDLKETQQKDNTVSAIAVNIDSENFSNLGMLQTERDEGVVLTKSIFLSESEPKSMKKNTGTVKQNKIIYGENETASINEEHQNTFSVSINTCHSTNLENQFEVSGDRDRQECIQPPPPVQTQNQIQSHVELKEKRIITENHPIAQQNVIISSPTSNDNVFNTSSENQSLPCRVQSDDKSVSHNTKIPNANEKLKDREVQFSTKISAKHTREIGSNVQVTVNETLDQKSHLESEKKSLKEQCLMANSKDILIEPKKVSHEKHPVKQNLETNRKTAKGLHDRSIGQNNSTKCKQKHHTTLCENFFVSGCSDAVCDKAHFIPECLNLNYCKYHLQNPEDFNPICSDPLHYKEKPHLELSDIMELYKGGIMRHNHKEPPENKMGKKQLPKNEPPRPQQLNERQERKRKSSNEVTVGGKKRVTLGNMEDQTKNRHQPILEPGKVCVEHKSIKKNLCSYYFQGLKCKFGRNCFNAHEISSEIFEINFCKLFLQWKCKTKNCFNEHLSFTKLVAKYHSQLDDLVKNCSACSNEIDPLPKSQTQTHSSNAGEDLRWRIRGNLGSLEFKREIQEEESFSIFSNEREHRIKNVDLRHSLQMRNKDSHLDLRETLELSKSTMRRRLGSRHSAEEEEQTGKLH